MYTLELDVSLNMIMSSLIGYIKEEYRPTAGNKLNKKIFIGWPCKSNQT